MNEMLGEISYMFSKPQTEHLVRGSGLSPKHGDIRDVTARAREDLVKPFSVNGPSWNRSNK